MDPLEGNALITENDEGYHEIWEKYFILSNIKKNIDSHLAAFMRQKHTLKLLYLGTSTQS